MAAPDQGLLLARCQRGEHEAITELVRAHHGLLLAVARSLLGQKDAEDACQDAWIAALRGIGNFEGRSSLRTWLTRIVINEAKMRLRQSGREAPLHALPDEDPDQRFAADGHWQHAPASWGFADPQDILSEHDLRDCLHKTLEALPGNQRLVLELRDLQGLELEEICNTLDIGASNVRVLLHRARTRVYRMIDHYSETGTC